MTLIKDTMDAWLEAPLEYVRDQLVANATIGVGANGGAKIVGIGDFTLQDLARHPQDSPAVWIVPRRSTPRRQGNVVEHAVSVELRVYGTGPLDSPKNLEAAQKAHRQFTGKTWNEALHLRETGAAAGHWEDWDPEGPVDYTSAETEDKAIFVGVIRMRFIKDVIWMSEGA